MINRYHNNGDKPESPTYTTQRGGTMQREILLDNDYLIMWFYPRAGLIHHKFKRYVKGKPFREMLMTGTKAMKERGADKWLSDDRDMPLLSPDDREWGKINWFPETVKAGWKFWAIVESENRIGSLNMKKLIRQYSNKGITAKFFKDPGEAFQWIIKQ